MTRAEQIKAEIAEIEAELRAGPPPVPKRPGWDKDFAELEELLAGPEKLKAAQAWSARREELTRRFRELRREYDRLPKSLKDET